jgi:hypothetical protein
MPPRQIRTWYWNGEDPLEEIERRIAAACLHYGIAAEDIGDRLFINSGRETEIVIASQAKNGITIAVPVVAALKETILRNRIDVVCVDPFVRCHAVQENDNVAINTVARLWAEIAEATNCAIDLVHHIRKGPNGTESTIYDARGAAALVDASRSARVLNVMSKDEAERAGIEEKHRRHHFRVTNGKANLAPPPDKSLWRQLVSVPLGNEGPSLDEPQDHVAVVAPWTWPNPFADVTTADLIAVQKHVAKGKWRENNQAKDWVGKAVAEVLKLDVESERDKEKIKGLLKVWIENGALKVVKEYDPKDRKDYKFVTMGEPAW